MKRFTEIEVTGDLAGVITMPKQIEFAAAQSLTGVAKRAQKIVIEQIQDEFVTRGDWYLPSRRHGIRIKTATRANPEAVVYSMADWLLEAHGFHGGIKQPDKGGKNLAIPDDDHTRHGIRNKIAKAEKARKLLDNTKRTKAFKIKARSGAELILQRVGLDSSGNIKQNKRGGYLRGRGKNVPSKTVLKYILQPKVKVPYNPVIFKWTIITARVHFGSYFAQNLEKAIRTARIK